jgi:hypothetical protein
MQFSGSEPNGENPIRLDAMRKHRGKISLDLFQLLAVPPNKTTLELAYQIPITNQTSLGGGDVGNAVSAGSPVSIYVAANSEPRALIDLTPAPSGITQCTVSVSGVREFPE